MVDVWEEADFFGFISKACQRYDSRIAHIPTVVQCISTLMSILMHLKINIVHLHDLLLFPVFVLFCFILSFCLLLIYYGHHIVFTLPYVNHLSAQVEMPL